MILKLLKIVIFGWNKIVFIIYIVVIMYFYVFLVNFMCVFVLYLVSLFLLMFDVIKYVGLVLMGLILSWLFIVRIEFCNSKIFMGYVLVLIVNCLLFECEVC